MAKKGYKRSRPQRRRKYRKGGKKWLKRKMKASRRVSPMFMPDRYFTKLKYTTIQTLADNNVGDGYVGSLDFRGNSLHDPESAFGGGQPLAYDQLSAFYRRYRVYASKVIFKVQSLAGAGTVPYYSGLIPYTGVPPTAIEWIGRLIEQPYARYTIRNQYDSSPYVKSVMSTSKIFGVPKVAIKTEDQFSAEIGSNPVNQWFWRLCFGAMNPATVSTTNYVVQATIVYYCEFYDRRNLTQS